MSGQIKALFWKEWLETRMLLAIALLVFLGLPLVGGIEERVQHGHFEIIASAWVYYLGGMLAIFVGVGTVVRDLNGRLEDFWRSRPVDVGYWVLVKYLIGLLVVLVTLMLPLVVEMAVNVTHSEVVLSPRLILAWHPFVWAALYSIAFVLAALVRRGAHAAMLAIAAMLLLYFLPQVLPPLRHISLEWVTQESQFPRENANGVPLPMYHGVPWTFGKVVFRFQQLQFALAMLLLCGAALGLSLAIVRRNWRVESGRRTIYWSIGGALLIVFASASFQLATNLTLLQSVDLPANERVELLRADAAQGLVVTQKWVPRPKSAEDDNRYEVPEYRVRPFRVTPAGIEMGEPTLLPGFWWQHTVWQSQRPNVIYAMTFSPEGPYIDEHYPNLVVIQIGSPVAQSSTIPFPQLISRQPYYELLYATGDRLYMVYGTHVVTFDLADPLKPRMISEASGGFATYAFEPSLGENARDLAPLPLPDIPGLSARQRLEARVVNWPEFDGNVLTWTHNGEFVTYRLDELTDTMATFRKVGRYDLTPVQKLLGSGTWQCASSNGLFFQSLSNSRIDSGLRLAVFDVHDPQRPHPIAHFAYPGTEEGAGHLLPLPDGRLLTAGGNHLWLISAPPSGEHGH